jgi:adenine-specific DNA-methyltransferase
MRKLTPADPETKSADIVAENVARLRELFPEAFTEGKIDFEVLKQVLGGAVDEREEKYGLNWHGKRQARQWALTPSTGTLRPCPEESVDWDTTQNLFIEGDNLEVLKLLQKSYAGKVQVIYVDPPYNTGHDRVYPDDYHDPIAHYLEITGQTDGEGRRVSSNSEASGRFHTCWLQMIYPRVKLARHLLTEDGLFFLSCDSSELHNAISVLNEVFGEENSVAQIVWKKSYGGGSKTKHVVVLHEYILAYVKNKESLGRLDLPPDPKSRKYYRLQDSKFELRGPYRLQPLSTNSNDERENLRYAIPYRGEEIWPEKQWQWEKQRTLAALANDELVIVKQRDEWTVNYKQYLRDEDGIERGAKPFSILEGPYTQSGTSQIASLLGDPKVFAFPKPTDLIGTLIRYTNPVNDCIVLDFFAGSGSTGEAVVRANAEDGGSRRYVLVQLPEAVDPNDAGQKQAAEFCDRINVPRSIGEITKERLRRSGNAIRAEQPLLKCDLGFRVFKLDRSNIRAWDPDRDDLTGTLLDAVEHLREGRSEQDILYELLLKLGLELTIPIETRTIVGKEVHSIGAGTLLACLAPAIDRGTVEPLALGIVAWHRELAPSGEGDPPRETTLVFRDSAFADDVAKTNLAAILEQHGLANLRSL